MTRRRKKLIPLFLLGAMFFLSRAYADNAAAVGELRNRYSNTCASGFFIAADLLVTNAHVAQSLCPLNDCSAVELWQAKAFGQMPERRAARFSLLESSPVLDLALFKVEGESAFSFLKLSQLRSLKTATALEVIGYPDCAKLTRAAGELQSYSALKLYTNVPVSYGSSGSPLLTNEGTVLGVVDQAAHWSGVVKALFFSRTFTARAVNLSTIGSLNNLAAEKGNLTRVLEHYRTHVGTTSGITRIVEGYEFLSLANATRREMLDRGESLSPLLLALSVDAPITELVQALAPINFNERLRSYADLMIAASIEARGIRAPQFKPISIEALTESFPSEERDHFRTLLTSLSTVEPLYLRCLRYGVLGVLTAILIAGAWGYSFGYVFCRASGDAKTRFAKSLVMAMLWPLSFLGWLLFRNRVRF